MPSNIPTGMKPDTGYEGGAWDTNPSGATITAQTGEDCYGKLGIHIEVFLFALTVLIAGIRKTVRP